MTLIDEMPASSIPRHIAIIMDGNGRWAVGRGLPRAQGHQQGAKVVKGIVTECSRLRREYGAPDFLTLYSFSLENWKRPASEVTFLMQMYIDYLRQERTTMMENNIRFKQIGRLENLPDLVLDQVNQTLAETAGFEKDVAAPQPVRTINHADDTATRTDRNRDIRGLK